jgi:hypothetical protein
MRKNYVSLFYFLILKVYFFQIKISYLKKTVVDVFFKLTIVYFIIVYLKYYLKIKLYLKVNF